MLGLLDVVVSSLDELEQDVLDVLANIAGFRQRSGVSYGKRHIKATSQCLRQVSLAATRRPDQQDIGLGDLNILMVRTLAEAAGLGA